MINLYIMKFFLNTIFSYLHTIYNAVKKSYRANPFFLLSAPGIITLYYVSVGSSSCSEGCMFLYTTERSCSVSNKTKTGCEPTANSYEPKASEKKEFRRGQVAALIGFSSLALVLLRMLISHK